jgi:hypothetical protein
MSYPQNLRESSKDPNKHNIYFKDIEENDFLYFIPKYLYGLFLCQDCRKYIYNMPKKLTKVYNMNAWSIYMCDGCKVINKGLGQGILNLPKSS